MSMQNVGILNKPQAYAQAPVTTPQNKQEKRSDALSTAENKNIIAEHKVLVGAVALASISVAGILIARGRNHKNTITSISSQNLKPDYNPENYKQFTIVKENIEKEKQLRKKIVAYFKAFRDGKEKPNENFENVVPLYNESDWEEFKKYLDFRMKNVRRYSDANIPADLREMNAEDVDAVLYFMKNYNQINTPLRNGESLSNNDNVARLIHLINDAKPLEEDVYVFRGVRTHQLYDDFKQFDFNELNELEIGDTIIDKGFVSTARNYDTELASVDPLLLDKPHKSSGYIMRIKLPKHTKGFDCRRLTQIDSDRGVNSTFILPPESKFEITGFDFPRRILDCNYILPE